MTQPTNDSDFWLLQIKYTLHIIISSSKCTRSLCCYELAYELRMESCKAEQQKAMSKIGLYDILFFLFKMKQALAWHGESDHQVAGCKKDK